MICTEGSDIVAAAVVAGGTVIGLVDMWKNGDGAVMTGIVALYGLVLGYVFGTRTATAALTVAQMKVAEESKQ